jgi:hypothetical protein
MEGMTVPMLLRDRQPTILGADLGALSSPVPVAPLGPRLAALAVLTVRGLIAEPSFGGALAGALSYAAVEWLYTHRPGSCPPGFAAGVCDGRPGCWQEVEGGWRWMPCGDAWFLHVCGAWDRVSRRG